MYQSMIPACGGKYELLEGRFFPPDYNNIYSANEHCDFHIKTFPGSQIMTAFSKFKLEEKWGASCVDYVEVHVYFTIFLISSVSLHLEFWKPKN